MKPINLKIKGLNSFIELQEVNFERLTEKGLFGIFGPTGSGKSTILDGIILALYGSVPRDSSNFMNTNCDTLNVSFEFQITEKDAKRYRVEREFKRDKSGSIKTKSAKIVDITQGEIILEERVRQVTDKCREIIGLEVDDFTRTVVLPQGNFSEFLKLQGKERREMLERLFNLQKYGDELSNKLSLRIGVEVKKLNILEGELKGYEDISDDILEKINSSLKEATEQIENLHIELILSEKAYNEGKEVWDIQNELILIDEKEKALKEKENEINELKIRMVKGESSLKIRPFIEAYESTLKQIDTINKLISNLKDKAVIINNNKNKIEILFIAAKNNKDVKLPELKVKEQRILDAIEEQKVISTLNEEKMQLEDIKNKIETNIKNANVALEKNDEDILNLNDNIKNKENKIELLKVPIEFKEKVNNGLLLINIYESLIKQTDKLNKEIVEIKTNINEAQSKSDIYSKKLNEISVLLKEQEDSFKEITDNCPGDQNSLLKLKENLDNIKNKWDKNKEFNELISKGKNNAELLIEELKDKESDADLLKKEVVQAKDFINNLEKQNLAHSLRQTLTEGEICPVCGSKEHHYENIKSVICDTNVEEFKKELKFKEETQNRLTAEIIKIQTNLQNEIYIINQNEIKLNELGEDYKKVSLDLLQKEFLKQVDEVNKYNEKKSNLDKRIKVLSEEKNNLIVQYNKLNSFLDHNKNQLTKIMDELTLKNEEAKEKEKDLNKVKTELEIDDFYKAKKEINDKENERSLLEKELKKHRDDLKCELQVRDELINQLGELKIKQKENIITINEKNKSIEEKIINIKNKADDTENLERAKDEILKAIKEIDEEYLKQEKSKTEIEKQFNNCNNEIMSAQGNLLSLKERCEKDNLSLKNALEEEGFKDIEEAKINLIIKSEIENYKKQIDAYLNSLEQIKGASINLRTKLSGRAITQEQWNSVQSIKNQKVELLDKIKGEKITFEAEYKKVTESLIYKKELQKNKDDLSHKLGLLRDLEKLFRGKKFVEYVAANQLKYVSIEAGKRLREITCGTYGLEVDSDGKFLIRDYKNGGAERDASTLSGGETFVASLALALALSSQIQLKGTAPLELFFLDEGFGTLDDNLLEIVMDSLEKIHHNKLSVGIISHVESIKNRVPLKLIVTPATSGLGGSKVKIEIN